MKKKHLYQCIFIVLFGSINAQTISTETFETETMTATTFTDNGRSFTVTSPLAGSFTITEAAGAGFNGTVADNKFLDNSATAFPGNQASFTVSSNVTQRFTLKSIYLFLSRYDLSPATGSSLTIVGKKNNVTVFTATANTGFNSNPTVNNGYTKIDFATFGGSNNTAAIIDQFVISTTGQFEYVGLDAMNWEIDCTGTLPPTAVATQSFCAGARVVDLTATGTNIKWYTDPVGGIAVASTTALVAGNYYATQTIAPCESPSRTLVSVVFPTTTWNGSIWSNGLPNSQTRVVFTADYALANDLVACAVTVSGTAVVTVPGSYSIFSTNEVIVGANATLRLTNNSNLVQINAATNTGNIVFNRSASMRRLDYTFWSSPVANQNLLAFTPNTLANRFYTYNEPTKLFVQVTTPSTTSFAAARGYSLRAPNNFAQAPAAAQVFTGVYTGVPNNGNITVPVTFTSGQGIGYNLIGNPYPSSVSGVAFLTANTGSVYFWTHQSSYNASNVLTNGGVANYASFNLTGAVASTVSGGTNILPNRFIHAGQGFMFLTTSTKIVTFTNAMRATNVLGQFYRTAQDVENDKIWLNLTTNEGAFSQTMIAYLPNTTATFDDGYDAPQINTTGNILSSKIDNTDFAIQSRGAFSSSDVVKLSLNIATAGSYTLSKDSSNGIFNNVQNFYLKDNLLGTTHNIKETPYHFVSNAGSIANRFEIVYTSTLSNVNPVFDANSVVVFVKDNKINMRSSIFSIKNIMVYDLQGRLISDNKNINENQFEIQNLKSTNSMLVVKMISENGQIVSKKIIF